MSTGFFYAAIQDTADLFVFRPNDLSNVADDSIELVEVIRRLCPGDDLQGVAYDAISDGIVGTMNDNSEGFTQIVYVSTDGTCVHHLYVRLPSTALTVNGG